MISFKSGVDINSSRDMTEISLISVHLLLLWIAMAWNINEALNTLKKGFIKKSVRFGFLDSFLD